MVETFIALFFGFLLGMPFGAFLYHVDNPAEICASVEPPPAEKVAP